MLARFFRSRLRPGNNSDIVLDGIELSDALQPLGGDRKNLAQPVAQFRCVQRTSLVLIVSCAISLLQKQIRPFLLCLPVFRSSSRAMAGVQKKM